MAEQSEVSKEKVQHIKQDRADVVGEIQKALPSISGNMNNCTFNFNLIVVHFTLHINC